MAKITSAPSPTTFSTAWAEELNAAVKRAAGNDGRLTAAEAKRMAKRDDGDQFYADDALKYLDLNQQKSVAISKLADWAPTYALAAGAQASGSDGRISFADATKLPPSLTEDFFLLRGRALPNGPASEMAVVKSALEAQVVDLLMPSETDAKLKFVSSWKLEPGPIGEQTIRDLLGAQHDELLPQVMYVPQGEEALALKTVVEKVDADAFLTRLSTSFDPNDPDSVERAAKFEALTRKLHEQLTDLVVFRFGTVSISTFIVGRTRTGELAGLLTGQVET